MSKRKLVTSLFFVIVFHLSFALSIEARPVEAFKIRNAKLQIMDYPWAKELHLSIIAEARSFLADSYLTVSLYYLSHRVKYFDVLLLPNSKKSKRIYIKHKWEALNGAIERILPGDYIVKIELDIRRQSPIFQRKWREKFGSRQAIEFHKRIPLKKENFLQESEKLKQFYLRRMRTLNALFRLLQLKKKEAMGAKRAIRYRKKNDFVVAGAFAEEKWHIWFEEQFLSTIRKERNILSRHKSKVFFPRYPITLASMNIYTTLLLRMGKIASWNIYKTYKIDNKSKELYRIDSFAVRSIPQLIKNIQRLHAKSAAELRIILRKELGYLPPPVVH